MLFVDKPYISHFFRRTVRDNAVPMVKTPVTRELGLYSGAKTISEDEAVKMVKESDNLAIYTPSENSIGWLSEHPAFRDASEKISLFKDKLKFREMTKSLFPDFSFKAVRVEDFEKIPF
jgi:hypothetical protein